MEFVEVDVAGAYLLRPQLRTDERGLFARIFCTQELAEHGLVGEISQVNTGFSPRAGTLRGMHFQTGSDAEVKIMRCVRGAAYDVVVDLRADSPTFLRWFGAELTPENGCMLYAPAGTAHGYLTLEPDTELTYTTNRPYAPHATGGVRFDDPSFGIRWPREIQVISQADRSWPAFRQPQQRS